MGLEMKLEQLGWLMMDGITPCVPPRGSSVREGGTADAAAQMDLGTELRSDTPPFPLPSSHRGSKSPFADGAFQFPEPVWSND